MKDIKKAAVLSAISLFTCIFIYPLLHEAGHVISALIFGCEIKNVSFFPLAFTECEMNFNEKSQICAVGISGIIFPFIVSFSLKPKSFYFQHGIFTLKWICILSYFLSLVSSFLYFLDITVSGDDMVTVLVFSDNPAFVIGVLVFMLIFSLIKEIRERPLKRYLSYFGLF